MLQKQSQGYASIGDFYEAILDKLAELQAAGLAPFAQPNLDRQVDIRPWFPHVECGDGKVSDMDTARAAGVRSVGVTWGFRDRAELYEHGADHVVDRPGEILELL